MSNVAEGFKKQESKSWHPAEWSSRRQSEYIEHVLRQAYAELSWWLGELKASSAIAEIRRRIDTMNRRSSE